MNEGKTKYGLRASRKMLVLIIAPLAALAVAQSNEGAVMGKTGDPQAASAAEGVSNRFDVVSIRPVKVEGDQVQSHWEMNPFEVSAYNMNLRSYLLVAYGILVPELLTGLPGWADSELYNIEAKYDAETSAAMQKLAPQERLKRRREMVQAMLADRFKLRAHYEDREMTVLSLLPAKGGFKLKPLAAPESPSSSMGPGELTATSLPLKGLATLLSSVAGRAIDDRTGIDGQFDINLKWSPDPISAPDDNRPDLYTALRETLGLKLEAVKASTPVLVVDHLERPTAN